MKKLSKILCLTLFLSLLTVFVVFYENSVQTRIEEWAISHGYVVVSIERIWFDPDCPFWYYKGSDIRQVKLSKKGEERSSYFRFTILGMEQGWKI